MEMTSSRAGCVYASHRGLDKHLSDRSLWADCHSVGRKPGNIRRSFAGRTLEQTPNGFVPFGFVLCRLGFFRRHPVSDDLWGKRGGWRAIRLKVLTVIALDATGSCHCGGGGAGAGLQANRFRLCCSRTGGCRAVDSRDIRGAPASPLLNELSRVVSAETSEVGKQQMRWVSRLWEDRGGWRAIRQTVWTSIAGGAGGGCNCGGGGAGAGLQANRLRLCCSSTEGCRAVASRALRSAPSPLSLNELSRVVSSETAEVGKQLMQRVSRLWGRGEGGGLVGKPCWPSLQEVQEAVVIVAGGGGRGLAGKPYRLSQ